MDRPIVWQTDFSVGIQVIDDQHRHMIEIINHLFDQLSTNLGPIEVKSFFEDAVAYGEYHFQTEENFFNRYPYAEQTAHLRAHHDYKEHLTALINQPGDNREIAKALLTFLEAWWVGHITGMDQTLRTLVGQRESTST